MYKKIILLFVFSFVSILGFAQEAKADRFLKKGDFIKAAEIYEQELEGEKSKVYLKKLADCYYNTYNYEAGIKVLKALIEGDYIEKNKEVTSKYNFIYYQFLSATGDYETAIDQLAVYKNKNDELVPDVEESLEKVETFRLMIPNFEVQKVNFNSKASDYAAVQLDKDVYFSSDREGGASSKEYKRTHRPFLDLYVISLDSMNNGIGNPEAMPKSINSELHEGSLTFSQDGNTIYFSRSNLVDGKRIFTKEGRNQVQLYVSKKKNDTWTEPKKLPFCSGKYNYQHPSVSTNGKMLYYATDETGSKGNYDIYRVSIDENGVYGTPQNLGDIINTNEREQFPYISKEGHLFFASNGHLGLGLLDLFVSKFEEGVFTEPVNLGAPINSRFDDISLVYSGHDSGFFSSNRDNANDDIFSFKQTDKLFIREYVNSFGINDNITSQPIPNVLVSLKNEKGAIVYENTLDEEAKFKTNLSPGNYTIEMSSPGFQWKTSSIQILAENNGKHSLELKKLFDVDMNEITKNVSVASKKVITALLKDKTPPRITRVDGKFYLDVPHIYFDYGRWEIREDSKILLNNLILKLIEYPSLKLRINSHTDNRGTVGFNQLLSEKRGQSTRTYLIKTGGLEASRVSFKGFGESELLIECGKDCSEKEHQKNRRSQFELIEY